VGDCCSCCDDDSWSSVDSVDELLFVFNRNEEDSVRINWIFVELSSKYSAGAKRRHFDNGEPPLLLWLIPWCGWFSEAIMKKKKIVHANDSGVDFSKNFFHVRVTLSYHGVSVI
jgi:hypothetical protein